MATLTTQVRTDSRYAVSYCLHLQNLINDRLVPAFHDAELHSRVLKETKCPLIARQVLNNIERDPDIKYSIHCVSPLWNLLDYFESLVSGTFCRKTTIHSACQIGRLSADQMAEFIETDSYGCVKNIVSASEYEVWLHPYLQADDARTVNNIWSQLIYFLLKRLGVNGSAPTDLLPFEAANSS